MLAFPFYIGECEKLCLLEMRFKDDENLQGLKNADTVDPRVGCERGKPISVYFQEGSWEGVSDRLGKAPWPGTPHMLRGTLLLGFYFSKALFSEEEKP